MHERLVWCVRDAVEGPRDGGAQAGPIVRDQVSRRLASLAYAVRGAEPGLRGGSGVLRGDEEEIRQQGRLSLLSVALGWESAPTASERPRLVAVGTNDAGDDDGDGVRTCFSGQCEWYGRSYGTVLVVIP